MTPEQLLTDRPWYFLHSKDVAYGKVIRPLDYEELPLPTEVVRRVFM